MTTGPAFVEMRATSLRTWLSAPVLLPMAEPVLAGVERFEVAGQAVAVLLIAQHAENGAADLSVGGERGGVVEGEMAGGEALHDGGHFAGGGFAEAEFRLVGRHGAGGGNVDLLVEHGLLKSGCAQRFVDVRKAEAVDGHVGGGVVAEHDHQRERRRRV